MYTIYMNIYIDKTNFYDLKIHSVKNIEKTGIFFSSSSIDIFIHETLPKCIKKTETRSRIM